MSTNKIKEVLIWFSADVDAVLFEGAFFQCPILWNNIFETSKIAYSTWWLYCIEGRVIIVDDETRNRHVVKQKNLLSRKIEHFQRPDTYYIYTYFLDSLSKKE